MYAPQGHPAVYFSVLASSLIVKNSLSECMATVITSIGFCTLISVTNRKSRQDHCGHAGFIFLSR